MSKNKDNKPSPSDYFPLTEVIMGDYENNMLQQERHLITQLKPMHKIATAFMVDAPESNFWVRINGAGQLSFYRPNNGLQPMVHAIIGCRLLSPAKNENAKPEISLRFTIQVNEKRYCFARLNAIKTPDGQPICTVCAIQSTDLSAYHFQTADGHTFTGSKLEYPIKDLSTVTRLNHEDLIAAVNLAKLLSSTLGIDNETKKVLIHLRNILKPIHF